MDRILEINNLTVTYGKGKLQRKAVDDLCLSMQRGEILGFLGPNGAGKTSTIKTLLGLLVPRSGEVTLFGKPISYILRQSIGYMPEIANYYWYLTPRELLTYYGNLFGIKKTTLRGRIDEVVELVDLKGREDFLMKTFSKGMLQKVNFAQSMINDPELLILDEPTTGLDPISRMKMRDILTDIRKRGKTVFFSSHELSEVETISDRVAILKNGRLLRETSPKDIIDQKGSHVSLENYFFELVREKR